MGRRWARVWLGKGWLSGCSRKPDSLALAPIYAGHDGVVPCGILLVTSGLLAAAVAGVL